MIGPHQGKELALMLKGEKHLALFHDAIPAQGDIPEDIIPERAFVPHVAEGIIKRFGKDYAHGGQTVRYVCFTSQANEWRAHAFFHFHEEALAGRRPFDEAYEYAVGRLLDYSEADIRHYIEHSISLRKAS